MHHVFESYLQFACAALVKIRQTGAIIPSQRILIEKMIGPVPRDYSGQIVELGAGNGALTVRLAGRCPRARILACEINPSLARDTRRNLDLAGINGRVQVVSDSAEHVLSELSRRGVEKADYIVSGIPLGNLGREKTINLVTKIERGLAREGLFIQFQYSLITQKTIRSTFSHLRTVPVLLNFPPAVVYYARK
jgi:phospholipid N-methyltransferase